jgi:hypothetical protein
MDDSGPHGYRKDMMTEVLHGIPRPREESDLARVVGTLRRSGPLGLDELCDQPDFVDWPARRVEQAVITAWSDNLIFIDPRDLLVAL